MHNIVWKSFAKLCGAIFRYGINNCFAHLKLDEPMNANRVPINELPRRTIENEAEIANASN